MNCQNVGEDGIAEKYLKGELEPPVQDEFEVHILECPRCLQSVETLQEMRTALAAQAHEIRLASQRPSFRLRHLVFAAVALVVFVGIGVLQLRKRKPAGAEVNIVQHQAPPSRDASLSNSAGSREGSGQPALIRPFRATATEESTLSTA